MVVQSVEKTNGRKGLLFFSVLRVFSSRYGTVVFNLNPYITVKYSNLRVYHTTADCPTDLPSHVHMTVAVATKCVRDQWQLTEFHSYYEKR